MPNHAFLDVCPITNAIHAQALTYWERERERERGCVRERGGEREREREGV